MEENKIYELIRYELRAGLYPTKQDAMIAAIGYRLGSFRIREYIVDGKYLIFDPEEGYVSEAQRNFLDLNRDHRARYYNYKK